MSAPMLLPLILLGGATIALAAASKKKYDTPATGTVRTYTLDTSLPQTVRDQVLAALATEQDPTKLEAFASAIAPTYPLSAAALRQKASMLRAGTLPTNPVDLLTQVPDPPRTQVMQQLMMQNDPNALEAYAAQLQAQFPAAAAALRLKEAVLLGEDGELERKLDEELTESERDSTARGDWKVVETEGHTLIHCDVCGRELVLVGSIDVTVAERHGWRTANDKWKCSTCARA